MLVGAGVMFSAAVVELELKLLSPRYCACNELLPPGNWMAKSSVYPKLFNGKEPVRGLPLSRTVKLPVGQLNNGKPLPDAQETPALLRTSMRRKYGEPYTAVVAFELIRFPCQSKV